MVVGESLFSLACNQPTELLISKSSPPESTLRRRCRGVVAVAKLLPCQSIAVESGVFPCCTLSRSLDESDHRCRRRRRVSTKLLRRRSFCQRGIWLPLPPCCRGDPLSSLRLSPRVAAVLVKEKVGDASHLLHHRGVGSPKRCCLARADAASLLCLVIAARGFLLLSL